MPFLGGNMRKLIMGIIAAVFAAVTASAIAADPVKTDPNPGAKPGRAIDDATVKTDPAKAASKPGRAADEPAPTDDGAKKKKKGKKKKKAE
jgi:hypothetical protein